MTSIFVQGFLLQASLILALGAQNIFVLNSGLRRERHLLVSLVSSICDTILILVGVLGVATIFVQIPLLKLGLGAIGVLFLFVYGIKKILEAKRREVFIAPVNTTTSARRAIFLSLGFSLLNPHVYLDTVVLIGGYSSQFLEIEQRLTFGLGASVFSILWFFGLATLASSARELLGSPRMMRIVSLLSGLILILLSFQLGRDLLQWV